MVIRPINTIRACACGIFLWVILVVRLLITQLQNHDLFSELQGEINSLPQNLKNMGFRDYHSSRVVLKVVQCMGLRLNSHLAPCSLQYCWHNFWLVSLARDQDLSGQAQILCWHHEQSHQLNMLLRPTLYANEPLQEETTNPNSHALPANQHVTATIAF